MLSMLWIIVGVFFIRIVISFLLDSNIKNQKNKSKYKKYDSIKKINLQTVSSKTNVYDENHPGKSKEVDKIEKYISSMDNTFNIEENNYPLFYGEINKNRIDKVSMTPKIREQLYRIPEGVYLNINAKVNGWNLRQVKVVRRYIKSDDTIGVYDRHTDRDGELYEYYYLLNAEEIFEALGINEDMTSMDFFIRKFENYKEDDVVIMPQFSVDNINYMFECYMCNKKDLFVYKLKKEKESYNEDVLGEIYDFFETKVNPILYDLSMCYVAMHEYDYPSDNENKQLDKDEIFRICRIKFPWLNDEEIESYMKHIWFEKGARIFYEMRRADYKLRPYHSFAVNRLKIHHSVVNRWLDNELVKNVENRVMEEDRKEELNEFIREWYNKRCNNDK